MFFKLSNDFPWTDMDHILCAMLLRQIYCHCVESRDKSLHDALFYKPNPVDSCVCMLCVCICVCVGYVFWCVYVRVRVRV